VQSGPSSGYVAGAVREGHIQSSPVAHIEKPTPTRRELVVTPDQWTAIIKAAGDQPFLDLLTVLRETGCRPQEVRQVEACHFDEPGRRWIFPRELSKGKRYNRVVYLNDLAVAITQRLAKQHPTGPLFRNRYGQAWNRNSIRCRFRAVRDKVNIPGLCAYTIRHTWATDALQKGIDPITLAILMGHVDTTTLARTYQHLTKNSQYLHEANKAARNGDASTGAL
jgi:integrase